MTSRTPIRFIGSDSDSLQFETQSWTRKDVIHEVHVCKRTGLVTCSCEDAGYRHKAGNIMRVGYGHVCKHASKLLHDIGGVLAPTREETNGTEN